MSPALAFTTDPFDTEPLASRPVSAPGWGSATTAPSTVASPRARGAGEGAQTAGSAGLGSLTAELGITIAGLAPPDEYKRLLRERQTLAIRQLDAPLAPADLRALRLVSWHLDRIESAKYQPSLDAWRVTAQSYSKLADEISELVTALSPPGRAKKQRA